MEGQSESRRDGTWIDEEENDNDKFNITPVAF